jgi:aromatic-L-amino-acid/L-tryptophan decarboxylase
VTTDPPGPAVVVSSTHDGAVAAQANAPGPAPDGTFPLEPDRAAMTAMAAAAAELVADFVEGLPSAPAINIDAAGAEALVASLSVPPSEGPAPSGFDGLLDRLREAAAVAIETAGPSYMAYVGGGGLYTSALAEFVARGVNRFTGLAAFAPALVAMEESTIHWLAREFGLPAGSGGLLTTGGSLATLVAVVAARTEHLDRRRHDLDRGTVYVTAHTHQSLAKAARIAGVRPDHVRVVPTTADLRMDPAAAEELIAADRAAGLVPFLLVGTAGTTNTGTVDPLGPLADVARDHGLWFHVDGAYGGFFHLTDRGRARLAGIERAESLVLDPHKGLFLPHGTGVALVREAATLRRAFNAGGDYLQDVAEGDVLPDYADMGPELTRDFRGLRLWLPLHLHGVGAFRAALDEKLELAALAYDDLSADPRLELPWPPDLSTVAFRLAAPAGDQHNEELLARINATRRVHLSSTRIHDRHTLRLCIISHRTHPDRVREALHIIHTSAAQR